MGNRNPQASKNRSDHQVPPPPGPEVLGFCPEDFAVHCRGFGPERILDEVRAHASDDGFLRIRPRVFLWGGGLCGSMALGNPPTLEDLDCFEGSKKAGHWDYWEFIQFVTSPCETGRSSELLACIAPRTFFDMPGQVVLRCRLPERFSSIIYHYVDSAHAAAGEDEGAAGLDDDGRLRRGWDCILDAFREKDLLAPLGKQTWTVDGHVFSSQDPDD